MAQRRWGAEDGAEVCVPPAEPCVVYSAGAEAPWAFEAEALRCGCRVFVEPPAELPGAGVLPRAGEALDLPAILRGLGHNRVDVLRVQGSGELHGVSPATAGQVRRGSS